MKFFESLQRIKSKDLYVGKVYQPSAFFMDKDTNKKSPLTKGDYTGEVVVVSINENGDYVNVENGTIYIDGSKVEKINDPIVGECDHLDCVEGYLGVYMLEYGKRPKEKITKREAVAFAKLLTENYAKQSQTEEVDFED